MKTAIANKKLETIISKVEKEGIAYKGLVEDLKELREQALKEQDPLVVKVLRLSYEYLLDRNAFDVQAQYEEDEEVRELAVRILAAFKTKNSVEALSQVAIYDLSSSVLLL